jgi:hypothetical protein
MALPSSTVTFMPQKEWQKRQIAVCVSAMIVSPLQAAR